MKRESRGNKIGLESQQNVFRNNPVLVPLHCGQVIMLLIRWLKKANIFLVGIRKNMLATCSKRDLPRKRNGSYYFKVSLYRAKMM
jgi:hypothetical protein